MSEEAKVKLKPGQALFFTEGFTQGVKTYARLSGHLLSRVSNPIIREALEQAPDAQLRLEAIIAEARPIGSKKARELNDESKKEFLDFLISFIQKRDVNVYMLLDYFSDLLRPVKEPKP